MKSKNLRFPLGPLALLCMTAFGVQPAFAENYNFPAGLQIVPGILLTNLSVGSNNSLNTILSDDTTDFNFAGGNQSRSPGRLR